MCSERTENFLFQDFIHVHKIRIGIWKELTLIHVSLEKRLNFFCLYY
jgi:hypothetical protein